LIQNEINAEAIRQKLSRRPLFNASDAFEALDKDNRGKLGITEFQELLIDNGIYVSSKDAMALIERFDRNQDGKVTYSEFLNEMTPKSPAKIYWELYMWWLISDEIKFLSTYYLFLRTT